MIFEKFLPGKKAIGKSQKDTLQKETGLNDKAEQLQQLEKTSCRTITANNYKSD